MSCPRCNGPMHEEGVGGVRSLRCLTCGNVLYDATVSQSPTMEAIATTPITHEMRIGGSEKLERRVARGYRRFTRDEALAMAQAIREGSYSLLALAREKGCHTDTIKNAWKRFGIPSPTLSEKGSGYGRHRP